MKVEKFENATDGFKPIRFVVTLESRAELLDFYARVNAFSGHFSEQYDRREDVDDNDCTLADFIGEYL